jgi:uncharacterized protein YcfL
MAKYGFDYYGIGVYGPFSLSEFNAFPFTATPVDYGKILLSWNTPAGDWAFLRVVRNSYGFPVDASDGDIVLERDRSVVVSEVLDEGLIVEGTASLLQGGRYYYYSVFVRENETFTWRRAANTVGLSVQDFNTAYLMYDYIPEAYKATSLTGDILSQPDNTVLRNFLRVFAFEHDHIKSEALNLLNLYNVDTLSSVALFQLLCNFGFTFEPEVGLKQSRILLRNAINIYKSKGSKAGINTYIKSLTGYDVDLSTGYNMILDYNDSSFEENVGRWNGEDVTLSIINSAGTILPYLEPTSLDYTPNKNSSFLKLEAEADSDIEIFCVGGNPITSGIPVKGDNKYLFSVYTTADDEPRSIVLSIYWYDRFGMLIGSSEGASFINTTNAWETRPLVTDISPVNAYYAVPSIKILNADEGEIHYFDAAQFEIGDSISVFQEARRLDVVLKASRINQVRNPNFIDFIEPWNATGALLELDEEIPDINTTIYSVVKKSITDNVATIEVGESYFAVYPNTKIFISGMGAPFDGVHVVTLANPLDRIASFEITAADLPETEVDPAGSVFISGHSIKVTPSGFGEETIINSVSDPSEYYSVLSDNDYAFSVVCYTKTNTESVTARIYWYDQDYNPLSSTECFTECDSVTVNPGEWVRVGIVATAPSNAVYASAAVVYTPSISGSPLNIDQALFEKSSFVDSYFDGSLSEAEDTRSLSWEDTPNNSRSFYFSNRTATEPRLLETLSDYLVSGTTFAVFWNNGPF